MELFSYFRSSAAYRVRIGLNLKQLDYTVIPVDLLKGEQTEKAYKAVQPQGLVPALRIDGQRVISQSSAILEYLDQQYPDQPLLPADPFEAATVRGWVNTIACDIHPLDNLRVLKYLKHQLKVSEEQKKHWYHHWINEGFRALEPQLAASPYCYGAEVTLADLYLVPQVYNALRFDMSLEAFPNIMAIYRACNEREAFIRAQPEQQADAP